MVVASQFLQYVNKTEQQQGRQATSTYSEETRQHTNRHCSATSKASPKMTPDSQ